MYSTVPKETKGDCGSKNMRSGPVLAPSLHRTNRIFSPDQKLALVRWLDTLSVEQRQKIFQAKKNKWGIHPIMLRQWFSQFKRGVGFKLAWRETCVSDAGIQRILDAIHEGEVKLDCLSLPQVKAMIQAEYEKEATERGEVFLRTLSDATLWRVVKVMKEYYALTTRPNVTTASRYRAMASARRAVNFFCCATALHSHVNYPELLLNVDSTQFCYEAGSGVFESYFHSRSTKANVKGAHNTLKYPDFITMWVLESAGGTLGTLLFVMKCKDKELPGNRVKIGRIPMLSPHKGFHNEPAYIVFTRQSTAEHSWVVNGIKLEIIIDYVKRVRATLLDKPADSHLPDFFKTINESEGDWKVPESVIEAGESVGEVKEAAPTRKRRRPARKFLPLPFTPSPTPETLKHRSVVWVDSENTFMNYLLDKKQQDRCSTMVLDIVKSNPGATAVEQPADQDGFRDVKKLLRRLKSSTPEEDFLTRLRGMLDKAGVVFSPKREGYLCCFFSALRKVIPLVYADSRIEKQFTTVFGPDPLHPSLEQIVRACIGWKELSREDKLSYIAKTPLIIDRFKTRGFVTDEDWEGCPWDPEFDQHRDHLTLSHQVCLHVNHEGSRKKREEEEKKALEAEEKKKKAPEEKKKEPGPKKVAATKTKKLTEKKCEPEEEAKEPEKPTPKAKKPIIYRPPSKRAKSGPPP